MQKWKIRILTVLLCTGMCFVNTPVIDAEDYSDIQYWTNLCTSSNGISSSDKDACTGFYEYMKGQSSSLKENISAIDSQREEIANNIEQYALMIKDYQSQIDDLKVQIDDLQVKIENKQQEIEQKQSEIEALRTKVKKQITNSQPSMRIKK